MIAKEFEVFLLEQEETFLTPAEQLAVLIDTHNIDHAKLLLSHMTYSRVPVVTESSHFLGTIGLRDILLYQSENELTDDELGTDISQITQTDVARVREDYSLEEVCRLLVEESFLPVVSETGILIGIITRKSLLKAMNALLHDFALGYKVEKK